MIKFLLVACLAAATLLPPRPASAEPDSVQALKDKATADLNVEVSKLKMKYLIALEKFQKALAAEGNLDGALAIKKETDRANTESVTLGVGAGSGSSASFPGSAKAGQTVILEAKDGRLGNGTRFDAGRGLVKGWSRYGAFTAWSLNEIKSGTYKATIHYRSGNLGGGSLSIATARDKEKFSIAGAGSWDEPRTHNLGNFYLSSPDHLTIVALQGRSREMIYVEKIVLEFVR